MNGDEPMPAPIEPNLDDPRIQAALEELKGMILAKFPTATFDAYLGPDSDGIWLAATVDVDDLDEVTDVVFPRIVDMQVDDGLPVNVVGDWPLERLRAYLEAEKAKLTPLDPADSFPILSA